MIRRPRVEERDRPLNAVITAIVATALISAPAARCKAATLTVRQDIRDIFLSVPLPPSDLDIFAKVFGEPSQRRALLEKTNFAGGKNVLDIPNGYLRIETDYQSSPDSTSQLRIVVTYFTKHNGDRLVVVQTADLSDFPDPIVEDGFYLLANGKYAKQQASQYLPTITLFGDFWGNQPLPDDKVRQYARITGDASFYTIDWPRSGTVARAQSYLPYSDTDTKEMNRIQRILGNRQFKDLELIWDKDKGIFIKGGRTRNQRVNTPSSGTSH